MGNFGWDDNPRHVYDFRMSQDSTGDWCVFGVTSDDSEIYVVGRHTSESPMRKLLTDLQEYVVEAPDNE